MYNYVNEDKFFAWYEAAAKTPLGRDRVLQELAMGYMATRRPAFTLSAEETVSGREEIYEFRFEMIGCCGAGTPYFYF